MATVTVEMFFRKLLPGRLTVDEQLLRQSLHDTCKFASRVLPRHVPLQQWIEKRMPGELSLAVDGSGWVNLWKELRPPVTSAQTSQPAAVVMPPVEQVSKSKAETFLDSLPADSFTPEEEEDVREQVSKSKAETFFDSLPADSFTPEEEDLREAILAEVASDGKIPTTLVAAATIVKHHSIFLPPEVMLEEWAEQRIGNEILISVDRHGERFFQLPDVQRDEQRNAFFDSLPRDALLPKEVDLREAILDFIALRRGMPVTLAQLAGDHKIGNAKRAVLQKEISLREWLEHRMASEFRLAKDRKGEWNVHIIKGWR